MKNTMMVAFSSCWESTLGCFLNIFTNVHSPEGFSRSRDCLLLTDHKADTKTGSLKECSSKKRQMFPFGVCREQKTNKKTTNKSNYVSKASHHVRPTFNRSVVTTKFCLAQMAPQVIMRLKGSILNPQ